MSCTLYIFSPLLLPTQPPSQLISRTHQPDSSAGLISRTHQPDSEEQDSGRTQAGLRQDSEVRGQRSGVRGGQRSGIRGQRSGVRGQGWCQVSGVRVYQGSSGCITHHTTPHTYTPPDPHCTPQAAASLQRLQFASLEFAVRV